MRSKAPPAARAVAQGTGSSLQRQRSDSTAVSVAEAGANGARDDPDDARSLSPALLRESKSLHRSMRATAAVLTLGRNLKDQVEQVEWQELALTCYDSMRPLCDCRGGTSLTASSVWHETLRDGEGGLPCLVISDDGHVAFATKAFEALAGRSQDELVGRSPFEIRLLCPFPSWLHETLNGQAWRSIVAFNKAVANAQRLHKDPPQESLPSSPAGSTMKASPQRRTSLDMSGSLQASAMGTPRASFRDDAGPDAEESVGARRDEPAAPNASAEGIALSQAAFAETKLSESEDSESDASDMSESGRPEPFFKVWEPPTTKNFDAYAGSAMRRSRFKSLGSAASVFSQMAIHLEEEVKSPKRLRKKKTDGEQGEQIDSPRTPMSPTAAAAHDPEEVLIIEVASLKGLPRSDPAGVGAKSSLLVTCYSLGEPGDVLFSTEAADYSPKLVWNHKTEVEHQVRRGGLAFTVFTRSQTGKEPVDAPLCRGTVSAEQLAHGSFDAEVPLEGEKDLTALLKVSVVAQKRSGNPLQPRASLLVGEAMSGEALWMLLFTFHAQVGRRFFALHVPVILPPRVPELMWPLPPPPKATQLPLGHEVIQAALSKARESVGSWSGTAEASHLAEAAAREATRLSDALVLERAYEGQHFVPKLGSAGSLPLAKLKTWERVFARIEPDLTASWARPDPSLLPPGAPVDQSAAAGPRGPACCVSDPSEPDCPLVYVSPGFEDLTGYWQAFALGRNCRFVQPKDRERNRRYNGPELARIRRFCAQAKDGEFMLTILLSQAATGHPFWTLLYMQHVDVEVPGHGERRHYLFGLQIPLLSHEDAMKKLLPWDWTDQGASSLSLLRTMMLEPLESFDFARESLHSLSARVIQEWIMKAGMFFGGWWLGGTFAPPVGVVAARRFARRCKQHDSLPKFLQSMTHWEQGSVAACAVVDPLAVDCPLVYVDSTFGDLTGYGDELVLCRNTRALQPSSFAIARAANGTEHERLDHFCSRISGLWTDNKSKRGIRIEGYTGWWLEGGGETTFKREGEDLFSFCVDGNKHTGQLVRDALQWEDGSVWARDEPPHSSLVSLMLGERRSGERFWMLLHASHVEDELKVDKPARSAKSSASTAKSSASPADLASNDRFLRIHGSRHQSPSFRHVARKPQGRPYVRLSMVKLDVPLPAVFWHREVTDFDDQLPEWSGFLQSLRDWMCSQVFGDACEAARAVEVRYRAFLKTGEDYKGDHFVPRVGLRQARQFESSGVWQKLAKEVDAQVSHLVESASWADLPCCVSDPEGEDCPLVHVSKGFEQLTGYSKEQALGRNCRYLQPHNQALSTALNGEERARLREFCTSGTNGAGPAVPWILTLVANERQDRTCFLNLLWVQRVKVEGRTYLLALLTPLEQDIQRLVEALATDEDGLEQLQRLRAILRHREGSFRTSSLKKLISQSMAKWAWDFPLALELPSVSFEGVERRVPLVGVEVNCATARIQTVLNALESGIRHFHITFRDYERIADEKLNVFEVRMVSLRLAELLNLLRQHKLYYLRAGILFTVCSPPHLIDTFSEVQKALISNGYEVSGWLLDTRGAETEVIKECWARMSTAKHLGEVRALGLSGGGQRAVDAIAKVHNGARMALYSLDIHPGRRLDDAEVRLLQKLRAVNTTFVACNVYGAGQAWLQSPEALRVASSLKTDPETMALKWLEHQGFASIIPSDKFTHSEGTGSVHRTFVREYHDSPSAEVCGSAWERERPATTRGALALPPPASRDPIAKQSDSSVASPRAGRADPWDSGDSFMLASEHHRSQMSTSICSTTSSRPPLHLSDKVLGAIRRPIGGWPLVAPDQADVERGKQEDAKVGSARRRPHVVAAGCAPENTSVTMEWPRVSSHLAPSPRLPRLSCSTPVPEGEDVQEWCQQEPGAAASSLPQVMIHERRVASAPGQPHSRAPLPQVPGRPSTVGDGPAARAGKSSGRKAKVGQASGLRQSSEQRPRWSPGCVKAHAPWEMRPSTSSSSPKQTPRQARARPLCAPPLTART